jgi:hypothetical protein
MPVQGLVRLRRHLFGRQAAFGTKVPATRAYPFKGVPEVELNWTDPDIDLGSIDPIAAPHREAPALTAPLTDPQLAYNSIPILLSGFFGGAVEPTGAGTAQTWDFEPPSLTIVDPDVFTYEFGDDVLDDWYQLGDGMLDGFEITIPEGLGAVTTSMTWRFGSVASTGSTDSPADVGVPQALTVDPNPALVYGKDLSIYISSDPDTLEANQILDALHTGTLRFSGDVDEKRYANGTQTFDANAFVRTSRMIEVELTLAKTDDTVGSGSESDAWMSDLAVDRFIRLEFISTAMAEGAIPYSWVQTMPIRYYTRTEGEVGGNSVIVLTGHAWYNAEGLGSGSGAAGVYASECVNTLTGADLGLSGS